MDCFQLSAVAKGATFLFLAFGEHRYPSLVKCVYSAIVATTKHFSKVIALIPDMLFFNIPRFQYLVTIDY